MQHPWKSSTSCHIEIWCTPAAGERRPVLATQLSPSHTVAGGQRFPRGGVRVRRTRTISQSPHNSDDYRSKFLCDGVFLNSAAFHHAPLVISKPALSFNFPKTTQGKSCLEDSWQLLRGDVRGRKTRRMNELYFL